MRMTNPVRGADVLRDIRGLSGQIPIQGQAFQGLLLHLIGYFCAPAAFPNCYQTFGGVQLYRAGPFDILTGWLEGYDHRQ